MIENCKKVEGFGKRIEERRKQLKLSRPDVCTSLGIAISTLQAWETEQREPPISALVKLADILKVSPNYLLTGEQNQPATSQNVVSKAFESLEQERSVLDEVSMIDSFESIKVSAGFGSFNEGVTVPDGQEPYADSLLQSLGVKAANCAVFWANGKSMQPTIADGDQLLVDLSHNKVRGDDKIYLVQNGESVWVKRVKMLWDGVELISDNREEYEPIKITNQEAQSLQIIGQVVHVGHKLI